MVLPRKQQANHQEGEEQDRSGAEIGNDFRLMTGDTRREEWAPLAALILWANKRRDMVILSLGYEEDGEDFKALFGRSLGVNTEGAPNRNPSPAPSTRTARTARTTRQINGAKSFGG